MKKNEKWKESIEENKKRDRLKGVLIKGTGLKSLLINIYTSIKIKDG